ncbi:Acetyltransferase (GNAT) family protein [Candida albicans]|uniref:Acetyltransferase (GNAT) family protein n=1 Tax=Candida albicans TaxID=5476 RepID=A0A8H6BX81_CANAX|nr:Acetyltransferase (GNAT) family protein [Candida albicans]
MARDIIALDDLTPNNLGVLKKINEVTLPIKYPESWYKQILETFHNNHNLKFNDFVNNKSSQVLSKTPNTVYIESFAVLEAYRGLGIGKKLLNYLIEETKKRFIHEIIIHVSVANHEAISWYKKQGFSQGELVTDYYKDQGLESPEAYIFTIAV